MKGKAFFWTLALAGAMALALGASAQTVKQAEGVDLLEVDHKLYELGYRDGACNGVLDEVTINALRNFQIANGLEVTGEADAATVERLLGGEAVGEREYLESFARSYAESAALASGAQGDAVSRLQRALKGLGYFTGSCDGAFGEATGAAVCRFQLANGLNETGVADGAVFLRLYGGESVAWEDFLKNSCAAAGDSGDRVRTLQLWLKRKGYFRGACTGRYGEGTQQAVKRFQADNNLESSGDLDLETCRALYTNVTALMEDNQAVRLGDTGAEAEAVCRDLGALGYPAHARFNMQTQLALMQFQLANDLKVTGVADGATRARLRAENARRAESYVPGKLELGEEGLSSRIARQALALLGQFSELDTDFGFVQYVYLKCGVPLMDRGQLAAVALSGTDAAEAGSVLGVEADGRLLCGVATSDGALIYQAESGYIVMSYLNAMQPERVWLYRPVEGQ